MSWIFGMSPEKSNTPSFEPSIPVEPAAPTPTPSSPPPSPSPQEEAQMHYQNEPQPSMSLEIVSDETTPSISELTKALITAIKGNIERDTELLRMKQIALENECKIIELEARIQVMMKTPGERVIEKMKKKYVEFRTKTEKFIKDQPKKFAIGCTLTATAAGLIFGMRGGRVFSRYIKTGHKTFRPPPFETSKHPINDFKTKIIFSKPESIAPFAAISVYFYVCYCIIFSKSDEINNLIETEECKRRILASKTEEIKHRIFGVKAVSDESEKRGWQ